jgi:hypothetical protein
VTLSDREELGVVEGEEGRVSDALVDLRVDPDGDLEGDSERPFERDDDTVSSIVGVEEALFEEGLAFDWWREVRVVPVEEPSPSHKHLEHIGSVLKPAGAYGDLPTECSSGENKLA